MGRRFRAWLDGRVYCCSGCGTHVAEADDIVSKAFQGRHGRAYLFNAVVNVTHGPKEERQLITGLHTVRTSSCAQCGVELGWAYVYAYEPSQQYKVGKVILEKAMIVAENGDGGLSS